MRNLWFDDDGCLVVIDEGERQETFEWFNERYTRLPHYSDGAPVKMGDAVKDADTGRKVIPDCMEFYYDGDCQMWTLVDHRDTHRNTTCNKHGLTTFERYVEPDSLERIQEDARKTAIEYWQCIDANCETCVERFDGKTPLDYYGVPLCTEAQTLDLIERTRKLYEGGAE
jgi:hypothetical protein